MVPTESSVIGNFVNSCSLDQLIIRFKLSLDFNRYLTLWCTIVVPAQFEHIKGPCGSVENDPRDSVSQILNFTISHLCRTARVKNFFRSSFLSPKIGGAVNFLDGENTNPGPAKRGKPVFMDDLKII